MVKVKWTPQARNDLKAIYQYIALDSVYYAKTFKDTLQSKVKNLSTFPLMGRTVPEYNDPNVRELIHGDYRAFYEVFPNEVHILSIVHGKMKID